MDKPDDVTKLRAELDRLQDENDSLRLRLLYCGKLGEKCAEWLQVYHKELEELLTEESARAMARQKTEA